MKNNIYLAVSVLMLLACGGQNKNSFHGAADPACLNTGGKCDSQKIDPVALSYKQSCTPENPSASLLSGFTTFKLENKTTASLDLFLLANNQFELSYLESDGTYLAKQGYLKADEKLRSWSLSQDGKTLFLNDLSATSSDQKMIAQGAIKHNGSLYSVELKFARNLGSKGLIDHPITLNMTNKIYGKGLESIESICKQVAPNPAF